MRLSKGRENYGYFLMWISFQKWSVWSRAVDPTIRRNFGQRGQRDECDDGHFYRSTSGHLRIQFSRFDKRWNSYLHQNHAQWAKCGRGLSSSRRRGWWKSYLSGNLKKILMKLEINEKISEWSLGKGRRDANAIRGGSSRRKRSSQCLCLPWKYSWWRMALYPL